MEQGKEPSVRKGACHITFYGQWRLRALLSHALGHPWLPLLQTEVGRKGPRACFFYLVTFSNKS